MRIPYLCNIQVINEVKHAQPFEVAAEVLKAKRDLADCFREDDLPRPFASSDRIKTYIKCFGRGLENCQIALY